MANKGSGVQTIRKAVQLGQVPSFGLIVLNET